MIEITAEIIGPGIHEEYADALSAIDAIRIALGPQTLTNATPEGRVLLNVAWLDQEMEARRLPIPVDPSYVGTIFHLVGSHELAGVPGFQDALGRLWLVLKGYGLIKTRHLPVLAAMIDDYVAQAERCSSEWSDDDRSLIADLRLAAARVRQGAVPIASPGAASYSARSSDTLDACVTQGYARLREISASLLNGWRPAPARKAPLPAPMPGLPPTAPTLPAELEGRLP